MPLRSTTQKHENENGNVLWSHRIFAKGESLTNENKGRKLIFQFLFKEIKDWSLNVM